MAAGRYVWRLRDDRRRRPNGEGLQRLLKSAEDFVLGGFALLLASPLLLIVSIAIKLTSPGPVFYRQERVTWNGRTMSWRGRWEKTDGSTSGATS